MHNLPNLLQKLDISSSSVGSASLEKLYMWLKSNYRTGALTLKHLDLSNNSISDQVAFDFIQKLLSIDVDLVSLNLSRNSIGDRAMNKLSDFVEINITLQILNISWNRITEKGAVPLLKSIIKKW